jgi:hypothetical protein
MASNHRCSFFWPLACCSKKHGMQPQVNSGKIKQIPQDFESRTWVPVWVNLPM